MGKKRPFQPAEKFKNYSLPTTKPFSNHEFYEQKVWTVQEQIFKKLKIISDFLQSLYPKLTDDISNNIKIIIEKNLETLNEDLELMQSSLHKTPYSFNSTKLKINQRTINEMKKVCDSLQTVSSYENEFKKLSKLKHALHELEQLIQTTRVEKTQVKNKPKALPAKTLQPENKKKPKKKVSAPKAKPKTKLSKPKSKAPTRKAKPAVKKVTKTKPKPPKKPLAAKTKPKPPKKPLAAKTKPKPPKKPLVAKTKPKTKSSAKPKKK